MIIELLLDLIYGIFGLLMVPLKLPSLPSGVMNMINEAIPYLEAGGGILANYTPLDYIMTLFGVILLIDVGIMLYKFIVWIIKKIPMLGIE